MFGNREGPFSTKWKLIGETHDRKGAWKKRIRKRKWKEIYWNVLREKRIKRRRIRTGAAWWREEIIKERM